MRRKVLQDYINGFCKCAAERPGYYDLPRFLHDGPSRYSLDVIGGRMTRNGAVTEPISSLSYYNEWLASRAKIDHIIVDQIKACVLELVVDILSLEITTRYASTNLNQASLQISISCSGHLSTDEKSYFGKASAITRWGVSGYEDVYGNMLNLLDQYPRTVHKIEKPTPRRNQEDDPALT